MKHGILNIQGADCASCVFTIEYNGRKIDGVKDIHVDSNSHEIHVDYQGEKKAVLEGISNIVSKLGYQAQVITDETS